jgi:hypothetical protein
MRKVTDTAKLTPDQLAERWELWLKETETEAFALYSSRFKFENIQRMFQSNPALKTDGGGSVFQWLHRNFYTEYLIAVRREMEKGGGYFTLVNFLLEVEQHCETVLTRKRYVALYENSFLKEHGIPDKHFDAKHGAMCKYPRTHPDEDCISADSVKHQREELEKATEKPVNFANWFIAHRTRHKPFKMTLADMYRAVNRIFDTYALYHNIITGGVFIGKFPVPQFDWEQPFAVPWITSEFKPFEPPE